MKTKPFTIQYWEDDTNLRETSWNAKFLDSIKKNYNLGHQHAVLFVNKAQDRFRIVACFFGLPVLIIPPVDPANRLSIYLEVSRYMRSFSSSNEITRYVDTEIERTQERIERRKRLAKKAAKKRKRS
jgi:hypothetical protein